MMTMMITWMLSYKFGFRKNALNCNYKFGASTLFTKHIHKHPITCTKHKMRRVENQINWMKEYVRIMHIWSKYNRGNKREISHTHLQVEFIPILLYKEWIHAT